MNEKSNAVVWGIHVGANGDDLERLNSQSGPFPPEPGSKGIVSIGWPAVGDLRMYKDNYLDFIEKFRIVYPGKNKNERVFKTQANMVWRFAYSMKVGDFVICPSSTSGYLLVGKIIGEYEGDFHNELNLCKFKKNPDFLHIRKVEWLKAIPDTDYSKYGDLHRIGQLTVVELNFSAEELLNKLKE